MKPMNPRERAESYMARLELLMPELLAMSDDDAKERMTQELTEVIASAAEVEVESRGIPYSGEPKRYGEEE